MLILSAAIWFSFSPALHNDFVNWDDQSEIVENPDFNPVTWKGLAWNWSNTRLSLYMPVTYMVWGAVAALASRDRAGVLQPFAFHLLNLLLHLVCSGLVFFLILQLWRKIWPALMGAMVFAVHPLMAEPVAWASGMYTLLSSALCLGALLAYVGSVRRWEEMRTSNIQRPTSNVEVNAKSASSVRSSTLDVRRSTFALFFALATAFYLTALFTKAASVSLPIVAGVIDLLVIERPIRKIIDSLWLWVVLGVPVVLIAKHFQDVSQIAAPPLWGRPWVAMDAFGFYLQKIVAPIHLIPDYGRNPNWVMQHPLSALVSVGIATLAIIVAWMVRRKLPWLTAGVALLLAGISPYLGLTTFDFQYVSTVADRYAYFGLIGVAIIVAGVAVRSRIASVLIVVLVVAMSLLTRRQVQRWHDTDSLFGYTLAVNSNSLISHNVFGFIAAREHRPAEAEAHYLAALKIWPGDATIQFNLANLYRNSQPQLALERYALAVQYQPHFSLYRNNFAAELATTGHAKEAYDQWMQAISLDPDYIDARNNLADLLTNLGRFDEAADEYRQALRIDPKNPHASQRLRQLESAGGK